MLILAAVTVSIFINGNIFEQARNANIEMTKAGYLEKLKLIAVNEETNHIIKSQTLTKQAMMQRLENEKNRTRAMDR